MENRKAESLRADRTLEELQRKNGGGGKGRFDAWVIPYLEGRYPNERSRTRYAAAWKTLREFLTTKKITSPSEIRRDHCFEFREWRKTGKDRPANWRKRGAGDPTINFELKLLSAIVAEAVERGHAVNNPCIKLRIPRKRARERPEITAEEEAYIREQLEDEPEWMRVSFAIAMAQGCRLAETSLDLRTQVDLATERITFHAKGNNTFTTALNPDIAPLLKHLKEVGRERTWEFRGNASRDFSRFFAQHGMEYLCFHCTRVTAITRCARAGVPVAQALRFFGHASTAVHEIYQRLTADDVAR